MCQEQQRDQACGRDMADSREPREPVRALLDIRLLDEVREIYEKIHLHVSVGEARRQGEKLHAPERLERMVFQFLRSSTCPLIWAIMTATTPSREKTKNWEMTRKAKSRVRTVRSTWPLEICYMT